MPSEIVTQVPDPPSLVSELAPMIREAQGFDIIGTASHEVALKRIKQLRMAERLTFDHFEPSRKAADLVKQRILEARDGPMKSFESARRIYSLKCDAFEEQQQRIADEKQRELEALAKKQEEDRVLAEALQAQEAGDMEAAEEIASQPIESPHVAVDPEVAQVPKIGRTRNWRAEVEDMFALVQWCAQDPRRIGYLIPSMPSLNAQVRAQREHLRIPGVRAVSEITRPVRS